MAGKGISINFLADVRQFLRGADDVEAALDDVSDSLDDVARDGDDATEKLERSFRDLTQAAKRESDNAGDALSKNMKRGADDASEALEQVKDDGFSNAKEVAASFDGSAQSIVDGFQGAAAEAFSGFGPAGAVAGLVAAAGLGVVTAEIQKQEEATQRLKQYFADAYQAAAEEGRKYIDVATIQREVNDVIFNPERASEYQQAQKDAAALGLELSTVLLANAGDQKALNDVTAVAQEKLDKATEALNEYITENGLANPADSFLVAEQGAADRLIGRYQKVQEEINTNAAKVDEAAATLDEAEKRQRDAIQKTRDADQARWDARATEAAKPLPPAVAPLLLESSLAELRLQQFLTSRTLKINIEGRLANGQRVV